MTSKYKKRLSYEEIRRLSPVMDIARDAFLLSAKQHPDDVALQRYARLLKYTEFLEGIIKDGEPKNES